MPGLWGACDLKMPRATLLQPPEMLAAAVTSFRHKEQGYAIRPESEQGYACHQT